MNRGPLPGLAGRPDTLAKAQAAWGEAMPREVRVLAEACRTQTARAVSERLGYSGGVVSMVLANKYPGDMGRFFVAIRGAFMGEVVMCPVLDEIGKDRCLSEQAKPFSATSSTRARLFHACKTCLNRQQKDTA